MTDIRTIPSVDLGNAVRPPQIVTGRADARVVEIDLGCATSDGATPFAAASRVRLRLASAMFAQGRVDEALEQAVAVVATPQLSTALHSSARVVELQARMAQDDWTGARRAAQAILAGDKDPDADVALGGAFATLGWLAWHAGRARDAIGMLRAAVQRNDLACRDGGSHPRLGLALMLGAVGDFGGAHAVVTACRSDIETLADGLWEPGARVVLAALHLAAGRLGDAATEAEAALAMIETLGTSLFTAGAEGTLARVGLVRGDLDLASEHASRMRGALGDRCARSHANASCALLEAQLIAEHDGPAEAVASVEWLYADLSAHKPLLMSEPDAAVWLVRTAQAAGDVRRAESVVAVAESLVADNPDVEHFAAIASHARGLLDGDEEKLSRAAAGHRQPWSAASAREDTGLALARRDPEAAKPCLQGALSGFEAIGATRDAERVRERLQCVGRRRGRGVDRKVSGWASLTPTEEDVAGYVADGMTNRQVAAHMYLSRHTVDFHLRAIFRKLAVASRVELTRLVLERGAT